jgi:hypothetical protein
MNKEQWIKDILESTKGIKQVPSDPYMASRIEAKLQQPVMRQLPVRWIYASLAVVVLLFIVNISIIRRTTSVQSESSGVNQLINEYGWGNDNLYSINLSNRPHE